MFAGAGRGRSAAQDRGRAETAPWPRERAPALANVAGTGVRGPKVRDLVFLTYFDAGARERDLLP